MLPIEARWIMSTMQSARLEFLSPLLNIGSSTREFRENYQPCISKYLMIPLKEQGVKIIHMDIKKGDGVDIEGDLLEGEPFTTVSRLGIKSILCSNLLEHVERKEELCSRMLALLPMNGFIIATVPFKYPYHPDTIDTLFRPDITSLHSLFPNTRIINKEILNCGFYMLRGRPFVSATIHISRILLPFRKSSRWFEMVKWTFKDIYITCLFLQKI